MVSAVIQEDPAVHMVLPVPSSGQEHVPDGAVSPLLHPPATAPARPLISTTSACSYPSCPFPWGVTRAPHPHILCPSGVPQPPALGSSAAVEPAVSQDPVTAKSVSVQPHTALSACLHLPALVLHLGWQCHVSSICPFPPLCPLQPACTGWTFGSNLPTKLWK